MGPAQLRRTRIERGLTQEDLAAVSGINVRTIIRMEQGKPVRPDTVKAICAALDLRYAPWSAVEVIGSDRSRAQQSTGRLLAATESLPDVRYLAVADATAMGKHLRELFREGHVGLAMEILNGFWVGMQWLLIMAFGAFEAILASMANGTLMILDHDRALLGEGVGGLYLAMSGIALLCAFPAVMTVRDTVKLVRMFGAPETFEQGIAFGDDAIWIMRIEEGDEIALMKVDIVDPEIPGLRRVTVEDSRHGRVVVRIRLGKDYSGFYRVFPDHPGLVELIQRDRPGGAFQVLSVPKALAA